jgi:anti-sigma factor RsiW
MQCEQAQGLIDGYIDDALSKVERLAMQEHLKTCTSCSTIVTDYQQMGQMLRAEGRTSPPSDLAARVSAALDQAETFDAGSTARGFSGFWFGFKSPMLMRFAQQAAMLAIVSLVSVFATYGVMTTAHQSNDIQHDILNAHLRSLLLDSPVQVASTDQHTVRPWFAGRVDFSPTVRDMAADGFPLLGGRLDYVNDQRVGALVFKHEKHLINVFTWAASGNDQPPQLSTRSGYNIVSWTTNGVAYWAVSDLNQDELQKFQRLM